MANLPSFQFYPGDWMKDPGLRACSLEEKGAWIEILSLMHECETPGRLTLNGQPYPMDSLARFLGITEENAKQIVSKLLAKGVAKQEQNTGALICRRMLKDNEIRHTRAVNGAKGGKAKAKQTASKPPSKIEAKASPSSSSSSSTSVKETEEDKSSSAADASKSDLDRIWSAGVELLTAKGTANGSARSFLGRMVKTHSAPAVLAAVERAIDEDAVEPKAFIVGCLERPPDDEFTGPYARQFGDTDPAIFEGAR